MAKDFRSVVKVKLRSWAVERVWPPSSALLRRLAPLRAKAGTEVSQAESGHRAEIMRG